jgi:hypothetical protein
MRPKLQEQSELELAGRIILPQARVMTLKFQERSELKFVRGIIPRKRW